MPDDIETHLPNQQEVDNNLADLRARAVAAFPVFAESSLQDGYSEINPDSENLFLIAKTSIETLRAYYDYQWTKDEDGDEVIKFIESAGATITTSEDTKEIFFYKTGRKMGDSDFQNSFGSEDEYMGIILTNDGKKLIYKSQNIKGADYKNLDRNNQPITDTSIRIGYSEDGYLEDLTPPRFSAFQVGLSAMNSELSVLDLLRDYIKDPDQNPTNFDFGTSNLDIQYKKSGDEHIGFFDVVIKDQEGKPKYRAHIFRKINPDEIADALDFDQLLAHPDQPANGIVDPDGTNRRSWGDSEWRRASFPNLTGIKITPIDI
ncbi:MAG TPA: hypothetical protein VHE53_04390 [Patescibacteria group bacterium]|nr:hypothetical protein [Patescibacteria group bacterium]